MDHRSRTFSLLVLLSALLFPILSEAIAVQITATVPGCGDSVIGVGEQCDGANLGGATCASLGYASGVLTCTSVCTQNTSACSMQTPSSGGGGGGGTPVVTTATVAFVGKSYPGSTVTLLKDGQSVATAITNAKGDFQTTLSGLSGGNYIFSAYALDQKGVQSPLLGFPVTVGRGAVIKVSGISIAPSVYVASESVKQKDMLEMSGNGIPGTAVYAVIDNNPGISLDARIDGTGAYSAKLSMSTFAPGEHKIHLYTIDGGDLSGLSRALNITILANASVATSPAVLDENKGCKSADVNCDGRVNLVDLSVLLYWYKNPIPPSRVDLNKDGIVNIVDFSILIYRWTA